MSKIGIFMADGCEEIEGLTVVDIARRAGIEIDTISITGKPVVTSSHKVTFETDTTKEEADFASYDGIVLPGGMPGTIHLGEDETVNRVIKEFATAGKLVAAICAGSPEGTQPHSRSDKSAVRTSFKYFMDTLQCGRISYHYSITFCQEKKSLRSQAPFPLCMVN